MYIDKDTVNNCLLALKFSCVQQHFRNTYFDNCIVSILNQTA